MTPLNPPRADFRLIERILTMYYPGQVAYIPKQFELVCRAFLKLGGSWEKLFHGDIDQIRKLKGLVKVAVDHGYISRTQPEDPKKKKKKPKSG